MDAELKAKWVKALRSGKYEQSIGTLQDDQGYCCLGVLCKVADIDIEQAKMTYQEIPLDSPTIGKLQSMNDNEGASFAEIADYIETNL